MVMFTRNYFFRLCFPRTVLCQVHMAWHADETWQNFLPFVEKKTKQSNHAGISLFLV